MLSSRGALALKPHRTPSSETPLVAEARHGPESVPRSLSGVPHGSTMTARRRGVSRPRPHRRLSVPKKGLSGSQGNGRLHRIEIRRMTPSKYLVDLPSSGWFSIRLDSRCRKASRPIGLAFLGERGAPIYFSSS
eukprot:920022-Pyramimonas_sp.AAC.1